MTTNLPTRTLREHPDLDQLKRQAKELLDAFLAGDPDAVNEVNSLYHDADPAKFALHDAQLVLARAYGFDSWPKFKAYVEGATSKRFREAVSSGAIDTVRAMLQVRPELANVGIHSAVVNRSPEMVRMLMERGANARSGVYPHRDATTALTLATERGYDEIVAIIREAEQRRAGAPAPDGLFQAIGSGDDQKAIAMMEANPALIRTRHPVRDWTPLDVAAYRLNARLAEWLLDHGAEVNRRGWHDATPLDIAAHESKEETAEQFAAIATLLIQRGAEMTARAAAALGDLEWLRARHASGTLVNPIESSGGLLRIAASHNRPEVLALLLGFGFDPNERIRFQEVGPDDLAFTWGMPLWQCAGTGKYEMAEMLLKAGADPNADVYASGTPMFQAYSQADWKMVDLFTQYGGLPEASSAGLYRQTELARKMLAGEVKYRLEGEGADPFEKQLLWGATCGGDPEIVRMVLERIDWPRNDPRWFHILEQPLRIWTHGSIGANWDRGTYLTCFRLLLERCDPNLRGRTEELDFTILHSVAGSREHVTPEERVAFATMLLDAGARTGIRDKLLLSTPLGWACRWGRIELVRLLLERGADPIEADAEPWATPRAWAEKMKHREILALLTEVSK